MGGIMKHEGEYQQAFSAQLCLLLEATESC